MANIRCPACAKANSLPEGWPGGNANCGRCAAALKVIRNTDGSYSVGIKPMAIVPYVEPPQKIPQPPPLPKDSDQRNDKSEQDAEDDDPPATERIHVPRKPPFLTQTAAVVECPRCQARIRVDRDDLNKDVACDECRGWIHIVTSQRGGIPYDCPHCGEELESLQKFAGAIRKCVDCGQPCRVPRRPLFVRKVDTPSSSVARQITDDSSSTASQPRRCVMCSRFLRNPLPLCSKCQRLFGI